MPEKAASSRRLSGFKCYYLNMSDGTSTLLSSNLKRLREDAGLSQKALAEQSGVPRPTIAHLESGQANPTLSVVLKVASALGVGVNDLVEPEEAKVVIFGTRTLPVTKTSRVRRVQLAEAGMLRDPTLERIVVKAGSRLPIVAHGQGPAVLCVERGDFTLILGNAEYPLPVEAVARIRAECSCVTQNGGVLYLATSR